MEHIAAPKCNEQVTLGIFTSPSPFAASPARGEVSQSGTYRCAEKLEASLFNDLYLPLAPCGRGGWGVRGCVLRVHLRISFLVASPLPQCVSSIFASPYSQLLNNPFPRDTASNSYDNAILSRCCIRAVTPYPQPPPRRTCSLPQGESAVTRVSIGALWLVSRAFGARLALHGVFHAEDDLLSGDFEVLVELVCRCRRSEGAHADEDPVEADVLVPALTNARFAGDAESYIGE